MGVTTRKFFKCFVSKWTVKPLEEQIRDNWKRRVQTARVYMAMTVCASPLLVVKEKGC
jgi:hypothetical protein